MLLNCNLFNRGAGAAQHRPTVRARKETIPQAEHMISSGRRDSLKTEYQAERVLNTDQDYQRQNYSMLGVQTVPRRGDPWQ